MRLEPQPGERIDRSSEVSFTFDGAKVRGFQGDTIASALFGEGQRVFSRSFKYHRPRGLLCCKGACPNCMLRVDGVPNVRSCVTPIREGARVEPQNVWGSLDHDLLTITDKIGGPDRKSGVSTTWFQSFVGFLLLFAVIINLRTAALGAKFGVIRKS